MLNKVWVHGIFRVFQHFEQIFKTIQMRVSAKEMDARASCSSAGIIQYIVSGFLLGTQHIVT